MQLTSKIRAFCRQFYALSHFIQLLSRSFTGTYTVYATLQVFLYLFAGFYIIFRRYLYALGKRVWSTCKSRYFVLVQVSQCAFAVCRYKERKAEPIEMLHLKGFTVDYCERHPGRLVNPYRCSVISRGISSTAVIPIISCHSFYRPQCIAEFSIAMERTDQQRFKQMNTNDKGKLWAFEPHRLQPDLKNVLVISLSLHVWKTFIKLLSAKSFCHIFLSTQKTTIAFRQSNTVTQYYI